MPKIRITQTDLTGNVQQAAISNTVFVPVRASKAIAPTVVTNIESFETGELQAVDKASLGYVLCKHLLGIGLPVLVQGVTKDANNQYVMSTEQWNDLTDKNLYPIRFLTYGDLSGERLNQDMINVANTRKDCIALLDLDEAYWEASNYDVAKIRAKVDGAIVNGEFAAAFTPWFYSKVSDLAMTSYTQQDIRKVNGQTITNLLVKWLEGKKPAEAVSEYVSVKGNLVGTDRAPYFYKATFTKHMFGAYVVKYESSDKLDINGDEKDLTNPLTDADYVLLADKIAKINAQIITDPNEKSYYESADIYKFMRTMEMQMVGTLPTAENKASYYVKALTGEFYNCANFELETFYTEIAQFTDDNTSDPIGTKIPAAFGYLFAYANSIKNNPEWYAIAGFDRGVIPELSSVAYNYSGSDIEILQARATDRAVELDDEADNVGIAINPIAYIRPAGNIIYGNRTMKANTAAKGTTATSFLNVRNLVSAITKVMYDGAKKYTFEQNNDLLWLNFQAYVRPTLEQMKNGNGIADYNFVKEPTTAKARLKARVNIIPIEAVEDFDLSIIMTDDETLISG